MTNRQSVQSSVDWQSTKKNVLERNRHMFNNSDMSDVNFICEGSDKTFYAHKNVLGTSSVVFNAMFYGSLAMKDSTVRLSDTNEESLEQFLRFVYTDKCTLTSDNVVAIMYLAKKYILPSLNEKCVHFLLKILNVENVLDVLEQADCFDEKELKIGCWKFIVSNIHELVAFSNISQTTLAKLLKRDELIMQEESLEQFLRFVYTNECTLTAENVFAIMCLAKNTSCLLSMKNVLIFCLKS